MCMCVYNYQMFFSNLSFHSGSFPFQCFCSNQCFIATDRLKSDVTTSHSLPLHVPSCSETVTSFFPSSYHCFSTWWFKPAAASCAHPEEAFAAINNSCLQGLCTDYIAASFCPRPKVKGVVTIHMHEMEHQDIQGHHLGTQQHKVNNNLAYSPCGYTVWTTWPHPAVMSSGFFQNDSWNDPPPQVASSTIV